MVTQAIVYRKLPDIPHRQYVRRIVDRRHVLWHRDPAIAERMTTNDARTIAATLRSRSVGAKDMAPTEPPGEYGVETLEETL